MKTQRFQDNTVCIVEVLRQVELLLVYLCLFCVCGEGEEIRTTPFRSEMLESVTQGNFLEGCLCITYDKGLSPQRRPAPYDKSLFLFETIHERM